MTRGLVRKNNLSDLTAPERARINLGLQTNDYRRIRGLFLASGVTNVDVQRIANASSNFQNQVNSSTALLATITPALYADKIGDTLTGVWASRGKIGASGVVASGITLSGSTDALFIRSSPLSSLQIETASGITMPSGLTVRAMVSSGNVVVESGKTVDSFLNIQVNGVPYRIDVV
jgi:hypothetical protein